MDTYQYLQMLLSQRDPWSPLKKKIWGASLLAKDYVTIVKKLLKALDIRNCSSAQGILQRFQKAEVITTVSLGLDVRKCHYSKYEI